MPAPHQCVKPLKAVGVAEYISLSPVYLLLHSCIQVRVAGVSIAAALTATEAGRITMATQCHNVPGGIWGAAFGLLLDPAECSAVRQQVVSLFCHTTTTTTILLLRPFVRDYPGEPVPEETLTHPPS